MSTEYIIKFASMRLTKRFFILMFVALISLPSCMVLDGDAGYRKKNKCCGIIKCDMHRRSNLKNHKHVVNGSKKMRKKEQRIKRGY